MSKIKYILILLICYGLYKGYVAFTNFEIGVSDRVTQLEEAADFERQGEVIALMMYLGDPPELNEHLLVKNKSKCLDMKQIAEETSFAYYECAIVDANLRGGKIISINEELKSFRMTYDENNIFAKILRGEIPCKKIYEDEFVLSFHDINPQKKIHALVIPKGKYIDLDDFSNNASPDEMVGLLKGINIVAKKLGISVDTGKGYRALANINEHGGQEVPHLHFHLFGGEPVGKMVQ